MKPTEQLKEEHQAIKVALEILGNISRKLESGGKVNPSHLGEILYFIRTFADKCHHGKEEDLLFGAMETVGIPRQGGPIGVMLEEHGQGRAYVRGMTEAAEKYQGGDSAAAVRFAENARNYIALLTEHIDKEDNVLYPMADERLSPGKQLELMDGFEKVEREKIGISRHRELLETLHRLQDAYLK